MPCPYPIIAIDLGQVIHLALCLGFLICGVLEDTIVPLCGYQDERLSATNALRAPAVEEALH